MKRVGKRGEGGWEQITWSQALDEIAASGSRLLTEQVSLTPLRKLFIAWRSRWGI